MKIFKSKKRIILSIAVATVLVLIIALALSGKDENIHLTYKSKEGYTQIMRIYDRFLKLWSVPYEEINIETTWGRTHIIKAGKKNKKPLIVLNGASTNASMLFYLSKPFFENYTVYAVDSMGEPGKSKPVKIPLNDKERSDWLNEVFINLKIKKADIIGFSLGGYTGQRFLQYYPYKVNKLVSCLFPYSERSEMSGSLMIVMIKMMYYVTVKTKSNTEKFLKLCNGGNIKDKKGYKLLVDHFYNKFKYCKAVNYNFKPTSFSTIKEIKTPVMVLLGQIDPFFDANKAQQYIKRVNNPYVKIIILKDMGHLPDDKIDILLKKTYDFLKK